jgi:hypothetical protein
MLKSPTGRPRPRLFLLIRFFGLGLITGGVYFPGLIKKVILKKFPCTTF